MISNITLLSLRKFDLKLHHLLIIGILSLSFSISFLVRSQAAEYGWELNEFDPFFNYRATQYIVENGINEYFKWNDDLSWYSNGRDVSQTSQVILHITTAISYWIFGGGRELYDFTILFPVIFGSLSSIVIFALVRVIGGTNPYTGGYWGDPFQSNVRFTEQSATLIVDLIDPATKGLVWRAFINQPYGSAYGPGNELATALSKAFSKYPPAPSARARKAKEWEKKSAAK